jgi:hypothetical protein
MKIRKGFYITRYKNTLFLSEIIRDSDGKYWGNDFKNLDNGRYTNITSYWLVNELSKAVEYLGYGKTIESLMKKAPQYFV